MDCIATYTHTLTIDGALFVHLWITSIILRRFHSLTWTLKKPVYRLSWKGQLTCWEMRPVANLKARYYVSIVEKAAFSISPHVLAVWRAQPYRMHYSISEGHTRRVHAFTFIYMHLADALFPQSDSQQWEQQWIQLWLLLMKHWRAQVRDGASLKICDLGWCRRRECEEE